MTRLAGLFQVDPSHSEHAHKRTNKKKIIFNSDNSHDDKTSLMPTWEGSLLEPQIHFLRQDPQEQPFIPFIGRITTLAQPMESHLFTVY